MKYLTPEETGTYWDSWKRRRRGGKRVGGGPEKSLRNGNTPGTT